MRFPHGETVTVVTSATTKDQYGDDATTTETRSTITNVGVAPRTSTETTDRARTDVITGLTLYLPPGTVIDPAAQLELRDHTWEVEGEPAEWKNPLTGTVFGVEVAIRRVDRSR